MKKYYVRICWTGYSAAEVEAGGEDEAIEKAASLGPSSIDGFERWPEADMAEELVVEGAGV
jgi:hypothetical protein